jgi:hypothetical protein
MQGLCGPALVRRAMPVVLGHYTARHSTGYSRVEGLHTRRLHLLGVLTIQQEGCDDEPCHTLEPEAPFDESVLVCTSPLTCWDSAASEEARHRDVATRSREISNYLMYLLVTNPEMLVAGNRAEYPLRCIRGASQE